QECYNSAASKSFNYSLYSFEQSLKNQIELKKDNSYTLYKAFVIVIKSYTKQQGFQ
ncbi:7462_t:CDS:1, partial [Gigaspora rosea]